MLKPLALRAARLIESGLERIGDGPDDTPVLDPYIGYGRPGGVVLRARVLSRLRRTDAEQSNTRWGAARQLVHLFVTDEVPDATVTANGVGARSDAEGYVTLSLDGDFGSGWVQIPMALDGQDPTHADALIPARDAQFMVIADIDDTMIETGAHNLARNLWTTFTHSAAARIAHEDALRLVSALLGDGTNPIFYVSSSPWNMHDFLDGLFAHHGIPRGPIFLRDLGVTDDGVGRSHLGHKSDAVDTILAANPDLPAYLLGDSGQKDARVYLDAIRRHPGRILGVALREPATGEGRDDAPHIDAIRAEGVPCHHGRTFDGAIETWGLQ